MNRNLRIAAGTLVLLSLVFFPGFATGDGSACASGEGIASPQVVGASVASDRFTKDLRAPDSINEHHGKSAQSGVLPRTSYNDRDVFSSTALSSGTYNCNIWVSNAAVLTIKTGVNAVVNGDMMVYGGRLNVSGGTLTINGDLEIYPGSSVYASGTGRIIVNRAAAGGIAGAAYTGGDIYIHGQDTDDYGLLDVSGSASITVNNTTDGYLESYGKIRMTSPTAKMTLNVYKCVIDGRSTAGCLTAGTLVVNGDFYQENDFADDSFCPGPGFRTTIMGTAAKARTVTFYSSDRSYFTGISFSGGFQFTEDSWISIRKDLSTDLWINSNNAHLEYQGNLNGHRLTLTSKFIYPTFGAKTTVGSGTLVANGEYIIGVGCGLVMNNSAGKLIVNGTFSPADSNPSVILTAGGVDVNGTFHQCGSSESLDANSYTPGPNFTTRILGANRLVRFDDPETSYFTRFALASGASLNASGNVSINAVLAGNAAWNYPDLFYRGSLNGHTLNIAGSLTVPPASTLTVGGGSLRVSGDLTVKGKLAMLNDADVVDVGGSFLAMGESSAECFTGGKLYIDGDFTQSADVSPASFCATGSHMTILSGSGSQTVSFAAANTSLDSRFATLVVANDSLDLLAMPEFRDKLVVTGTSLQGIAADRGAFVPSAFDPAVTSYQLLLNGADGALVTPAMNPRYTDASLTIDGDPSAVSKQVSGVPYDGYTAVQIVAHAYADVLPPRTYTVKVETINPDLGSLNLPEGSLCEPDVTAAVAEYSAQLPATASGFLWKPLADNPDATVTVNGSAACTVEAAPGETKTYTVRVTAQDGTTSRDYTVALTRRNPVSNIAVSAGSLVFNPGTAGYTVKVPGSAASTVLTVLRNAEDCSKVEINGVEQDSVTLSPPIGGSESATIRAWDKDGKSVTTYTVTVNRIQQLSGIRLSAGSLSPAFSAATHAYSVYLPNTASSITVTPVKTSSCVTMKINGTSVSGVTLSIPNGGRATAVIACCDAFGDIQTYTVYAYRIAPVTGIGISGGKLSPAFSTSVKSYTVSIPATTASVKVTPVKGGSCKELQINGKLASSILLAPPVGGRATATIRATACNGAVYSYTVTVVRAPLITGISTSSGALSPAFSAAVTSYTVRVSSLTAQVKITAVKAASGVRSVIINGVSATSVTVKPPAGGSAVVTITATATNGITKVTYKVTVRRDPLIAGIKLSVGSLTPGFAPATASYTVTLPATASCVTITPVKGANVRTLTIDGKAAAFKTITVGLNGTVKVVITATATDGVTKSVRTVTVRRPAA